MRHLFSIFLMLFCVWPSEPQLYLPRATLVGFGTIRGRLNERAAPTGCPVKRLPTIY